MQADVQVIKTVDEPPKVEDVINEAADTSDAEDSEGEFKPILNDATASGERYAAHSAMATTATTDTQPSTAAALQAAFTRSSRRTLTASPSRSRPSRRSWRRRCGRRR
jgi:hypothetical protein